MMKKVKEFLRPRITDNDGLMGFIACWLLIDGWNIMLEKTSGWSYSFGLIIFAIGFFNVIPCVVKLINGKGLK
jgi:hypothetical protein